jgi:hypothetical protein
MIVIGTVLLNGELLRVSGASLSYTAPPYSTLLSVGSTAVTQPVARISVTNRASLTVPSGLSLTNLTSLTSDGTGSVSFSDGSALRGGVVGSSAARLSVSGCNLTLGGNITALSRLSVGNGSIVSLSSTIRTIGGTGSGLLALQELRVVNKSAVTGTVQETFCLANI